MLKIYDKMTEDIVQKKFEEVFEEVCNYVDNQRQSPDFTLHDLKEMLNTEYINEGKGWTGRSEIQEAIIEATIAAYHEKIAQWEKENQ